MSTKATNFQDDETIAECFRNMWKLVDELNKELRQVVRAKQAKAMVPFQPEVYSQVDRRLILRSVFSYLEAMVFSMKRAVVDMHPETLTQGDIIFATEVTYELTDLGQVVCRPAKVQLIRNVKFAFALFSKGFKSWTKLDLNSVGWQCLLRSIKVRDRITHPKSPSDLHISDLEIAEAHKVLNWFNASFIVALIEGLSATEAQTEELKRKAKLLERELDSKLTRLDRAQQT